jgi:hypothetical protein
MCDLSRIKLKMQELFCVSRIELNQNGIEMN